MCLQLLSHFMREGGIGVSPIHCDCCLANRAGEVDKGCEVGLTRIFEGATFGTSPRMGLEASWRQRAVNFWS